MNLKHDDETLTQTNGNGLKDEVHETDSRE